MKTIFIAAAILLCAAACRRATVPATTPVLNREITNENGQLILAGHASAAAMQLPNYKAWFDQSYNSYTVDTETAGQVRPLLKDMRMQIFLGTWCGDSRRETPRMLRLLKEAGMDSTRVDLIFVDNTSRQYKQSPEHEERGLNIHHVPTFILYVQGKEKGRIVESPVVSLEKDMLAILSGAAYEPNYRGISYWRAQVTTRRQPMDEQALRPWAAKLQPLTRHRGEFNAYANMLLAAGDSVEAANVVRLNTLLYPPPGPLKGE